MSLPVSTASVLLCYVLETNLYDNVLGFVAVIVIVMRSAKNRRLNLTNK